jgi:DNA polymerase III subunit delta
VPTVTPDIVQQQIASGKLQPVYLIVGDDERVIAAVSDALSNSIDEELRAFNYERLYANEKGVLPAAAVEAARVAPMMSPRRLVVVLRAEAWLKPKRATLAGTQEDAEAPSAEEVPDKSALGALAEYLKAPVDSTTLVLVASDVNKSLGAVKALYKSAAVIECWGLGDRDSPRGGDPTRQALAVIRQAAAAAGRSLEPAAAQMLAERSGGDIGKLRADLDHVLLFAQGKRAIAVADVEAVVSGHISVQDPWALVNAIERGNAAEALRLLGVSLEDGEAPLKVLGQLAWWVRDKLPRVRPQQAASAVQAVFRTDLDIKSSGGDPRVLLERLVMELCGAPRRRRA